VNVSAKAYKQKEVVITRMCPVTSNQACRERQDTSKQTLVQKIHSGEVVGVKDCQADVYLQTQTDLHMVFYMVSEYLQNRNQFIQTKKVNRRLYSSVLTIFVKVDALQSIHIIGHQIFIKCVTESFKMLVLFQSYTTRLVHKFVNK
jgi:hypothetical protein